MGMGRGGSDVQADKATALLLSFETEEFDEVAAEAICNDPCLQKSDLFTLASS